QKGPRQRNRVDPGDPAVGEPSDAEIERKSLGVASYAYQPLRSECLQQSVECRTAERHPLLNLDHAHPRLVRQQALKNGDRALHGTNILAVLGVACHGVFPISTLELASTPWT